MAQNGPETDALLELAGHGDERARRRLLDQHRARLLRMVAVRMDGRLAARLDPSDVVQEALADAARELPDYLRRRPMAFYPWLRQLAWDRLLLVHRHHIEARRRSVDRERSPPGPQLPDGSAAYLADRLIAGGTSPSGHLVREEIRARVREELARLRGARPRGPGAPLPGDAVQREIAEVLGITEGAVKVRHFRALERLRGRLDRQGRGGACDEPARQRLRRVGRDRSRPGPAHRRAGRPITRPANRWTGTPSPASTPIGSSGCRHSGRPSRRWPSWAASPAGIRPGSPSRGAEPAPTLGELGDFRILREIGRGGMGVVYEASRSRSAARWR